MAWKFYLLIAGGGLRQGRAVERDGVHGLFQLGARPPQILHRGGAFQRLVTLHHKRAVVRPLLAAGKLDGGVRVLRSGLHDLDLVPVSVLGGEVRGTATHSALHELRLRERNADFPGRKKFAVALMHGTSPEAVRS